jgi:peptide-methionine (S)-S-oxide reductase
MHTYSDDMLRVFWENHDPTQGMRQGNDRGTQDRSAIYCFGPEQLEAVEKSRVMFQAQLAKNPAGYCGMGGTGVSCPIGLARAD